MTIRSRDAVHGDRTIGLCSHIAVVGPADGVPSSAVGQATDASTPPRSSRWAVEMPTCRTHPLRLHRPPGCNPNKGWYGNLGKNEIECGTRCRRRARRPSGRSRAALALWDMSHRNGKPCRSDAGTRCSGTGAPDLVRLWQSLEASRNGILRFVT